VNRQVDHPSEVRWETRLFGTVTAVLTVFGIVSVYSAASFQDAGLSVALKQLFGAAVGAVVLLIASRIDYQRWRDWAWPILFFTLLLLVILLLPGLGSIAPRINGAKRWINVAGVGFQPSELARFAIVVWVAMIAAKKGEQIREFKKGMAPVLVVTGLVSLLVLLQPNLSMATIIAVLGGTILFIAGAKIGQFLLLFIGVVFAGVTAIMAEPYRFQRFRCFFGLASDCQATTNWQLDQATKGFASGRFFGTGFGEGQLKLNYLPYAPSDFLFSTVGEEWGFLGVTFVVALFGLFCWLGLRIARTAPDPFGRYLAGGLTASVGITALMHMAVNMGLMPTTGLVLPFMSAGRSNLWVTLLGVGVVMSVGRMRGRAVPP